MTQPTPSAFILAAATATAALLATAALAKEASPPLPAPETRPMRDPASVWLPAEIAAQLKLGSRAPITAFGATFERIAPDGALPVMGPGATLEIRAAADRARVFLAWTQYDLDGDGAVRRAEFDLHATMSWGDTLGERENAILDEEWTAADANFDAIVTHSEILGLALAIFPVPAPVALGAEGEAMLAMDLDNDGFVTWAEVETVLTTPR